MNVRFVTTIFGALLSSLALAAPYAVQPKDTLYSIAKKFNVPLEVLVRVNNLASNDLKIGQILEIPERQHTVIKGDTLFAIAKRYGTTIQALTDLNKLDSSGIRLGQVLLIPWEASFFGSSTVAVSSAPKPPVSGVSPAVPKPPSPQIAPVAVQPTTPQSKPQPLPQPITSPVPASWRAEPSMVLPQLPPPERPASTFPSDVNSAKPKNWTLLITAPLPVLTIPEPILEPPATASSAEPTFTHTVLAGDTLFSLAKRYGLSVALLRSSNQLASDSLRIGQVLQIPQADAPENKSLRGISERYLGVNYVYGGSSATGLDCSGFTSVVFKEFGITLPRVSRQQFAVGTPVERTDLREGDLVFFDTTGSGVSHVGIYLDSDEFIHAASNPGRVLKSKLTEKYYAARYLGARRVINDQ